MFWGTLCSYKMFKITRMTITDTKMGILVKFQAHGIHTLLLLQGIKIEVKNKLALLGKSSGHLT